MARDPIAVNEQSADADFAQDPASLLECVYNLLRIL